MHSFLLLIAVFARLRYAIQHRGKNNDFCPKSEEPFACHGCCSFGL